MEAKHRVRFGWCCVQRGLWLVIAAGGVITPAAAQPSTPARAPVEAQNGPKPAAPTISAQTEVLPELDQFLEALETADRDLRTLQVDVLWEKRTFLQGDVQTRLGTLYYLSEPAPEQAAPPEGAGADSAGATQTPPARGHRAFAVDFHTLLVDDVKRTDQQVWVFDGRWLIEKRPDRKVFIKREIAPPGSTFDPLRLGEGPMPVPIGQRKAEILARYDARVAPAAEGLDNEPNRAQFVRNSVQLHLVPKGLLEDDQFREIRLWYTQGSLLPRMACTVNRAGDESFVQLINPVLNSDKFPRRVLDTELPPIEERAQWDIQLIEGVQIQVLPPESEPAADGPAGQTPREPGPAESATPARPSTDKPDEDAAGSQHAGSRTHAYQAITPILAQGGRGERRGVMPAPGPGPEQVGPGAPSDDRLLRLDPAALRAIGIEYLTEREKAELRVQHGVWTAEDLADAGLRARAALIAGLYDSGFFEDQAVDPLDRAEAALLRGEPEAALAEAGAIEGPRAARLRAAALDDLGRVDEADRALDEVEALVRAGSLTGAPAITEAARALAHRARLRGESAASYQAIVAMLGEAHQKVDRLYWPAMIAEAELLYEKAQLEEAGKAAQQALTLCPVNARALALLGRMSVDGMDYDLTERSSEELRRVRTFVDPDAPTGSVEAELNLARAAMRRGDPALALAHTATALTLAPNRREALALRCAATALTFDRAATDALLAEFDRLSPGSALAHHEVGSVLSEARQYAWAAEHLNLAIRRRPNWAAPVVELGLLEMQSGRDTAARDALQRAAQLDPFNTRAANSLKLIEELLRYQTVEGEHFIVRYNPDGTDGVLAREMIAPLDAMHRVVADAIRHEPRQKTIIELLPDNRWFGVRITGMPGIHTVAASTGPVIAMEAPRIGRGHMGEYDWLTVLRHEYTHTVTLSRTDNRIPHWFTEAAAVYLEFVPRDYTRCQMLTAALLNDGLFDLDQINIAFVRPERPTDRAQAYAQGHWMYQFIVKAWGPQAPLDLMDQYAQGLRERDAMPRVLGVTQDEFFENFKAWAREDVKQWGMLPEPSMTALRLDATLAIREKPIVAATAEAAEAGALDEQDTPPWRGGVEQSLRDFALAGAWAIAGVDEPAEWSVNLVDSSPQRVADWLERHPDHPDLLELSLTDALAANKGEPTEAMRPLIERYAASRPVDPLPHRLMTRLLRDQGRHEQAIPHLEYLDAREMNSSVYSVELARRYEAVGDLSSAWTKAQRAVQISPFNATNRELAATIALRRGDLENAEHHIAALTELEPAAALHRQRLEAVRRKRAEAGAAP